MSDNQRNFMKMFGSNTSELCSICKKSLYGAGSPLPPPCSVCKVEKYCVRCSASSKIGGKIVDYCVNHAPKF